MKTTNKPGFLPAWTLQVFAATLLLFGVFGRPERAEARLDPFYIVHGSSYGKLKPRILFAVDSSATMRYEQPWPDVGCAWGECEVWGDEQSRVHAARSVINSVTAAASDEADFALMTFGQAPLPTSDATVPKHCQSADLSQSYRFAWVTTNDSTGYMKKISGKWTLVPQTTGIVNPFGTAGTWVLCGDNKLFPYLRHDNLGSFAMPDDSDAALPDMPLYQAKSTSAGFANAVNKTRKVQWFPRFLGKRGNLDCGDVLEQAIVEGSFGDFGSTAAVRATEVCNQDFYYWPYVDGFPGYSWHTLTGPDSLWRDTCSDAGACVVTKGTTHRGGVSRRHEPTGAGLFAPFYSKNVINAAAIPAVDKGPLTEEDALLMFDGMTGKMWEGGVDISGNKPFIEVIGDIDTFVTFDGNGLPVASAGMLNSNAQLSHTSVASYITFISTVTDADVCRPTALIFLTDAMPEDYKVSDNKLLYSYMRKFRTKLGVKTYVVGFSNEWWNNGLAWDGLNLLACSANGADNTSIPCGGQSDSDWDTCDDPEDHKNTCAFRVSTADELAAVLTDIIAQIIAAEVPSGAPTVANDFQLTDPNDSKSQESIQTAISSWTDVPGYMGHLVRGACDDEDPENPGQLSEYCQNAIDLPVDTLETESFGPCPIGRVWDAGECLAQTDWTDRRLYTHDANNNVFRIADTTGKPTAQFTAVIEELNSEGKISPALSASAATRKLEITAMTEWLLGRNMPDDWKLPGLPNAAPILIRRVPKADEGFLPTVGIRDPHCAGRRNALQDNIPESLEEFSAAAWVTSAGGGLGTHYDYTEAVLVGDDFGVLHGFHYDSGNELFGFIPRALINNARVLSVNGTTNFGQPEDMTDHVYGVASTVNAGWAFDPVAKEWRHLAVFGLGPGGSEILTVDVAHMGRIQEDDPISVVWTASTTSIADEYAATLGETWSRPALTYAVPNNSMALEPKAYMVFGSGYREGVGDEERGRTVWMVDAMTGETLTNRAYTESPDSSSVYDIADDVAAISDIAVGSHCLSRYWGEMQEAYWADPAGRLYRWDVGAQETDVNVFPHANDSGGAKWVTNGDDFAVAVEAFRFPACQGDSEFDCTISSFGGGAKGDVFTFSPAVVSNNRIDDIDDPGTILPIGDRDQYMIALVSGSPNDTAIDGGDQDNDFHSSIYLIADDHRVSPYGGFTIPGIGGVTAPGAHSYFMRLPLKDIERTRTIIFPDDSTEEETRNFSKRARPIRAPMIRVTGAADGQQQLDAEVFYITYTIYEPASLACNPKWYDADTGVWSVDPGATYEITFRLVLSGSDPFDFLNGYALPGDYGDGFGAGGKLSGPTVSQVVCEGENCGAKLAAPKSSPCDPNTNSPNISGAISVQTGWSELDGFGPLEVDL